MKIEINARFEATPTVITPEVLEVLRAEELRLDELLQDGDGSAPGDPRNPGHVCKASSGRMLRTAQ